jgi:hypothetical protein
LKGPRKRRENVPPQSIRTSRNFLKISTKDDIKRSWRLS